MNNGYNSTNLEKPPVIIRSENSKFRKKIRQNHRPKIITQFRSCSISYEWHSVVKIFNREEFWIRTGCKYRILDCNPVNFWCVERYFPKWGDIWSGLATRNLGILTHLSDNWIIEDNYVTTWTWPNHDELPVTACNWSDFHELSRKKKKNCSGASLERTSKSGIWFTQNNSRTYRNNVAYQQRYFSRSTRHIRPVLIWLSNTKVHYSNIIIVNFGSFAPFQ